MGVKTPVSVLAWYWNCSTSPSRWLAFGVTPEEQDYYLDIAPFTESYFSQVRPKRLEKVHSLMPFIQLYTFSL
jgi:hypothetical protein